MEKQLQIDFEEWRPVVGYEGLYEVSNLGRVKSLPRKVNNKNASWVSKERILKNITSTHNYQYVTLCKNGKQERASVHRLMGFAFLENKDPEHYDRINHKDEKPDNNYIYINPDGTVNEKLTNLEWCSHQYNITYGTTKERIKKHNPNIRKVNQYTLQGKFIKEWDSIKDIWVNLGFSRSSITAVCKHKYLQTNGFVWRYSDECDDYGNIDVDTSGMYKRNREIVQLNLDGDIIRHWESATVAARTLGLSQGNINKCCLGKCKQAYGYIWEFVK